MAGEGAGISICAGCSTEIPDRRFLVCSHCTDKYDLLCANVSEKRFYNTMTAEHKAMWICPQCRSNIPKANNTTTPVRQLLESVPVSKYIDHSENKKSTSLIQEQPNPNVTFRKKFKTQEDEQYQLSPLSEDSPPRGDTILISPEKETNNIVLKELREFRAQMSKQYETQEARICELSETINKLQTGINIINNRYTTLETEIKELRAENCKNCQRIQDMEAQNTTFQKDLSETKKIVQLLENKIINFKPTYAQATSLFENRNNTQQNIFPSQESGNPTDKDVNRTVVLYGLQEFQDETEYEIHDRVINAIYEVTNIDLTGYIEDVKRIGRRGWRRPIEIELLSKRLTKHLLGNARYFRNTGLWMSEFLDEKGRQERIQKKERYKQNKQTLRDEQSVFDESNYALANSSRAYFDAANKSQNILKNTFFRK